MEQGLAMMMLQSIAALAVVLALFALLVWGMKRLQYRMGSPSTSNIKVLQKVSLDTRHSVVEVRHGKRCYLLGLSTDGLQVIDTIERSENDEQANELHHES